MTLMDTHSHLYLPQFDSDREEVILRARESGVSTILLPNIDLKSIDPMLAMCDRWPDYCLPMMGLHPCDVREDYQDVLRDMRARFSDRKYYAVGETGIDLYWDKTYLQQQIESFSVQVSWAIELDLPIVIHARESFDELFAVLDRLNEPRLRGVFHCFTGTAEQAQKIISYGGFMMGIGGVLTYPRSGLDQVIRTIPEEYLLLETDSPFLAPKPHRGQRNESAYVKQVAIYMSEVLQRPVEEIAAITTTNARRLFRLP